MFPSDAKLIIEASVLPTDIDQVASGQPVAIRLASFNQRTTPELKGRVTIVSADLIADEQQRSYHYLVHASFDDGELDRLGGKALVPGMPAEVFIQTEERTVLDYLLKPMIDQFRRAMREE